MNQPRILVTGGTGFAGSHLIEALLAAGYSDIYSTVYSAPDSKVSLLPTDRYVPVNLTDAAATQALLEKVRPDWIFHLASLAYVGKSFDKARELFGNNLNLQLNLLDAVKSVVPKARVLLIGSAEEYGIAPSGVGKIDESAPLNPVNPYAVSKATQDLLGNSYFLSYNLQIVRARPFNHIGTRQTGDFAVPAFAKQIVAIERGQGDKLHVGNLTGVRDFTSVEDMVKAYILLMEKGAVGEVYNIGSGRGWQMTEVVEMLTSMATKPIAIEADSSRMRPLDVPSLIADNKKICALGWQPTTDIRPSLQAVLDEWRQK